MVQIEGKFRLWAGLATACCFTVGVAVIFGSGVARAEDWATVLAAARKDGRVVVYSAVPVEATTRVAEAFKKAYPDISVEILRGGTGTLLPKIDQERESGADGADLIVSTDVAFLETQVSNHRLLPLDGPASKSWPAKYTWDDGAFPVIGLEPIGFDYNPKLVKNPPKTFADLLKPEYKDMIGITDLRANTVIAWYDWLQKTVDPDYWMKLKAQNPKVYPGLPAMPQATAAGEIPIGNFVNPSSLTALLAQGAPIVFVSVSPAFGIQYVVGGFTWSRRPNAARVFVDYLMSREGQTAWHSVSASASPLPGISGSLDASAITPWNPHDYPPALLADLTNRWNKIFK